jgi:diguanylate cyclase (GGDEF)-like protein
MQAERVALYMSKAKTSKKALPKKLDLVFSTFIEVTGLITTGASMSRIISPILACACDILSGKAAFAILEQRGTHTRVAFTSSTGRGRPLVRSEAIRLTKDAARIYARRKATAIADAGALKAVKRLTGYEHHRVSDSVITAGLQYQRTRIGMIGVVTSKGRSPEAEDLGLFELLAREAGVAVKNAREFERTQTLSITDGLTGAYNYRFLIDAIRKEIGRAERFHERFSIIMLDVDGLKEYNDVHGHLKGSSVIKKVARLVSEELRSIDMLCKYGGDEFVVVLPRTAKEGAAQAAERIRGSINAARFSGERLTGKITASMGIASFPEHGGTVQELIHTADKALYKAKRHGRNQVWLSGEKTPFSTG